uniref:Platelet-derived growth factor subunit B n=1 Tax=Scleropages formosus TaxID=113540 RepID=A0A8D0CNE4_SCLFO
MSARLPLMLLLAALSAFPPFAGAQGDPLPLALVDLVMSSSIGSIKDLQQLLLTDSVEAEPDGLLTQGFQSNSTSRRLPRSANVQVAQQAQCKVRTEVMEVTRSMLDRRNANFVVWPPCVEVQRCSGCCNARTIKCVPTVISTRQLQVMKIQFVNKQKHYEKVVISVEDHVECRCQTAPPQLAPRTTARKPQHSQRPPAAPPEGPHLKTQSKQEIHRHDELKQNQNVQLKDLGLQGHQIQVKHPHTETPVTHGKEEAPFKQTPSGGQQMQDSTTQRPVEEREPRQKQGSDQHLSFTEEGGPHLQGLNSLQRHNHMQQEVGCMDITKSPPVIQMPTLRHEEARELATEAPYLDPHIHTEQKHTNLHPPTERRHLHKHPHGHNHKVTSSHEPLSTSHGKHPGAEPQQPHPHPMQREGEEVVLKQRLQDQDGQRLQEQQLQQRDYQEHQHHQHHPQQQTHTTERAGCHVDVFKTWCKKHCC